MGGITLTAAAASRPVESGRQSSSSTPLPSSVGSHSAPHLLAAPGRALAQPLASSALEAALVGPSSGFKSLPPLPGLAAFDIPSFDLVSEFEKSFNFSSTTEARSPRPATATESTAHTQLGNGGNNDHVDGGKTAAGATRVDGHSRSRSRSMVDRPLSLLPSSKSSPDVRACQEHHPKRLVKQNVAAGPESTAAAKPVERSRPVESFADFARRSWISKSRFPSPPGKPEELRASGRTVSAELADPARTKAAANSQAAVETTCVVEPSSNRSRALNRASVYLTKIKQKPQSVFSRSASSPNLKPSLGKSTAAGDAGCGPSSTAAAVRRPGAPAVAKNASYNSISSATSRTSSADSELDTDTATASSTSENASQVTVDTPVTMPQQTSRDPLWATFRTLDVEFARFAAKGSTAGRMSVIRSILVPFLRSTAYHPSNSSRSILTPEDIDRRATILNKWWNGLLGMLAGANSRLPPGLGQGIASLGVEFPVLQPVAGVDRPTLLEAASMIMMRPEWRTCTSAFQPLADRCPKERVRPRSETDSTVASEPDSLLTESVEHNVRTMFVTNLTTQMALVVEKMSLRHAPLSLVSWCGKACAYAFFFVPGVSDVLVRLWNLNSDLLRRIADEFGLPRRNKGESEDIVALFPSHLHKLGWSSAKSLADRLRVAANLPLMLAKIHWHGPWVSRWRGRDTDLVFIFCKYFYILAQGFMPEGLPLVEKARAPAFVLVHAQLLSILDSTIHRQASLEGLLGPPLSDALHGADAALTAPPFPSNLLKEMDENRLVILLKDMLADHPFGVAADVKHTFAEAFVAVAKAATKRTPRFEHASCFLLCDFLEEALVALDAFQNTVNASIATSPTKENATSRYSEPASPTPPANYVDWPFWFEVGKMIMDSNNTMSEIRILSFLFSVWDAITADPVRKEVLCLDWLLSEEVFAKFFNHWCPMVRAYYMRLLCWRICRDSGSNNEVDLKIFLVASQRLRTIWSHYLWLKQDAEAKGRIQPSTAPSSPAPGKRFLIIRTEVQPTQHSPRLGFDPFSSAFPNSEPTLDCLGPVAGNDDRASGGAKADSNQWFKRRWSLLGKVLPFSASQDSPTSETKRSWEEELERARRDTAASRLASRGGTFASFQPLGPPTPPKQDTSTAARPSSDSASSTGSAPVFDAGTFVFRFTLTSQTGPGGGPMPCGPARDRVLTRPRLPAPAQARVSVRSAGLNSSDGNRPPMFRSDSPPPIAPGLPPETRRVSGCLQTGLVSEARNAKPLTDPREQSQASAIVKDAEKRPSLSIDLTPTSLLDEGRMDEKGLGIQAPDRVSGFAGVESDRGRPSDAGRGPVPVQPPPIRAERPSGVYAAGAVYAGRALAEWSIVVSECNSFVDRRRDEGVLGLSDVEVPALGVEGLGLGLKVRG
ncbi:288cb265-1fd8-4178-9ff6-ab896c2eaad0 [Thermothielavioides terrestris]|uniref:DUF1765-domain-containing protein n=2 Tax=Thermothielavioides terrestris TaxID=2587410 RepID=G2R3T7_THETT|nr:uncharacterized protein THITE_2113695 [Thermothielavioides terrestris NRRL 8126]AEO65992.1 hypothetical protein THITE_2113695 [Thermothielavioides terrestris NRRL 8126]SPQ18741.1 288cb265-1fd8-4178-9ff6-ab896c2eaad0 [Thermothielavioides terrestris]